MKLDNHVKAYSGPMNEKITIAHYDTDKGERRALVLFQGIEGEWDGKVIDMAVRPASTEGADYVADYQSKDWKKDWVSLLVRKSYGYEQWEANYPGGPKDGLRLIPDNKLAEMSTPQSVQSLFEQQKKAAK